MWSALTDLDVEIDGNVFDLLDLRRFFCTGSALELDHGCFALL